MGTELGLAEAAQLFKVLGSESRLGLLRLLGEQPRAVGALVEATGLSQPLVSQHLRTLRGAGLVTPHRSGKEVIYSVADVHVTHIVSDALEHARGTGRQRRHPLLTPAAEHPLLQRIRKDIMSTTDHATAEHTLEEHTHGADCGHEAVEHDGHTDYMHDGHQHSEHGDHYDEH